MRFCGIQMRVISLRAPKVMFCIMTLKIILLKLLPHLPGTNELTQFSMSRGVYWDFGDWLWNICFQVVLTVVVAFILEAFLFRIQYRNKMHGQDMDGESRVSHCVQLYIYNGSIERLFACAVSAKFAGPRPRACNRGGGLANEPFAGPAGLAIICVNYI